MVARMSLALLPLLVIALGNCHLSAQTKELSFEALNAGQVFARCNKRLEGKVGESLTTTLTAGEGFVVNFSENAFGLGKFAGYLGRDGQFWIPYWDSDGYCAECNSFYKIDSMDFGVFGVAGTPLLGTLQVQPKGTSCSVSVRFSSDTNENAKLLESIEGDQRVGRMGFSTAEKISDQLISENDRIAGWAKLWSEVKFNFAYFDQIPEVNWEKAFQEDLPAIQSAKTNSEYYRILQRRVAMLSDGHTEVYGREVLPSGAWLPFTCRITAENQLLVETTIVPNTIPSGARRSEVAAAKMQTGEMVTHLNGQPINEFLELEIYPYISSSTTQWRNLVAQGVWDRGRYHSIANLTVRGHDGRAREVELSRSHYRVDRKPSPNFRMLERNVTYLRLDSFGSNQALRLLESRLDTIRKSAGLILDLRQNGGGDSTIGAKIISHLIESPIQDLAWKTRDYRPAFRAWGEAEVWYTGKPEWIEPSKAPFLGPIVVLIGPATFSAAEDFTVALHNAKRATIIGQRSAGSTGQPLRIQLPGGGSARICCKRDSYPDGREFVGVGVIPDIEIPPDMSEEVLFKKAISEIELELASPSQ